MTDTLPSETVIELALRHYLSLVYGKNPEAVREANAALDALVAARKDVDKIRSQRDRFHRLWVEAKRVAKGATLESDERAERLRAADYALQRLASKQAFTTALDVDHATAEALADELLARGRYAEQAVFRRHVAAAEAPLTYPGAGTA